jgi:hypothetical protein
MTYKDDKSTKIEIACSYKRATVEDTTKIASADAKVAKIAIENADKDAQAAKIAIEHANETAQVAKRDGDDYSIKKADYYAILAKDAIAKADASAEIAKDAIAKADASAEIAKNTIEVADDAIAKTEDKHNDNQANDKTQEDFNNKGTGEGIDVTDDSTAYDTNVLVIDMTNGTLIDQNTEGTQYKLTEDSVSDSTDDILIYQRTWHTEEGINLTDVFIRYGINDILIDQNTEGAQYKLTLLDQNTEETPYSNSTGYYKTVNESIVADISGNNWNEVQDLAIL